MKNNNKNCVNNRDSWRQ